MRTPGLMALPGATRSRNCLSFRYLPILVTWFTLVAAPCLANTFSAFGPQTFRRADATPVTVKATFLVLNPSTQYFVRLRTDRVASALVLLNGVTVIDPSKFNENVTSIEVPVTLKAANELAVEVRGGPGGTIVLEIVGIDNEPPSIVATATPPPNAGGWNNSNVTVTFTCADLTSGIASCPPPVGISTEGQGRSVAGTAIDKAGNTATASVTVNLDKTAPLVSSSQSPNANSDGWNNTPVVATFRATDALSGVAPGSVTAPITLTSDGTDLSASGQATDLAGNVGSVTRGGIKIDQIKPAVIATTSPAPNANGWNNTPVTVHFTCSDTGSGVATCPADQVVASDGANQVITGMAFDAAGNTATSGATVNVDRAPPVLTFASPANGATVTTPTTLVAGTISDATSGVAGVVCNGAPAIVTGAAFNCTVSLTPGTNAIAARVTDKAGNTSTAPLSLILGSTVTTPRVTITSPTDLSYTNISPTTVTGTVDDATATVAVNSIPVPVANGSFTLALPVAEGPNTITAVATSTKGVTGTASVNVTLDTTPPHVTVTSPPDGFVTTDSSISVAGIVNDIVVGTVNDQQAKVTVNGTAAQVANRTFLTNNVPLALGTNVIQAVGTDRVGNAATTQISVTRQAPVAEAHLRLISGNNQVATIGSVLAAPLVVALTDAAGNPVPNKPVVFKVTHNDGTLSAAGTSGPTAIATTDSQGQAQVRWTLGARAGAGGNAAEAYVVGFAGTALFTATGTSGPAGKIVIDTGNYQIGAIGEPLPKPLIAVVVDDGNNRLAGVPVTFNVTRGGGTINGQTAVTVESDSDGRVAVTLTLGLQEGNANNLVEVNFPSNQGFPAAFTASGRAPGDTSQTSISGVVLDNSNQPIPGVTMRAVLTNYLHANGNAVQLVQAVQTNAQGQFTLSPAPVGAVKLLADGSTAQLPGHYPSLEYDLETVAGQNNTVEQPIYLLPLDTANQLCVTATSGGGTLTIPDAPGFSLTFGPGQVTFPGGSKTGCVSVTVVHGDKVPMLPGFGQQPRFIVTIQPAGAVFNPPAPITLPNVDALRPRQVTEMYSFDHDIGSFVAIGTGVVSADGQVIRSSDGVGVLKAGWHCGGDPATSGTAATCPVCQTCSDDQCVPDNSQVPTGTPPVCNARACQNGVAVTVPDDSNLPTGPAPLCKALSCSNGNVVTSNDDGNTPPQGASDDCKREICSGGSVATANDDGEQPPDACDQCQGGVAVHRTSTATPFPPNRSAVNAVPPSRPLVPEVVDGHCTLGATATESMSLDISARCDGGKWIAVLTSLKGNYSVQAELVSGQTEVTGPPPGNTTFFNFCAQARELKDLGVCGTAGHFYMVAAVQAHEDVHVAHLQPALMAAVPLVDAAISALSVPSAAGKTQAQAIEEIKALPGYQAALSVAEAAWEAQFQSAAAGDHNGATNVAEHTIVDPMVAAICAYAKANNWGPCSACQ